MTTDAMPTSPAPAAPRPGFWRRYGALWAAAPKSLVAIIALGIVGCLAFAAGWALVGAGIGLLLALAVGVFVIAAALAGARWVGWADLHVIEWTGLPRIPRPAWPEQRGFLPWLGSLFTSPHYWLHLGYYLLPRFVLGAVASALAVAALAAAAGGLFWAFGGWMLAGVPRPLGGPGWIAEAGWFLGGERGAAYSIVRIVVGLLVAFCLPWILRGLAWAHWGLARLMLGAFRSEALQRELAGAEASRAAAVAAEDTALRRLERDIHDGPQQRLIRLQMDLASAARRLDDAPEEARALIDSAGEQAREALDELRALSRGFAPPILLDRGLIAALESAATRSAVPIDVVDALPAGTRLPSEIERNAYFIASEGLVNAVKHARARRIRVAIALAPSGRELVVTVSDDGAGGAVALPGHGLAGLQERIAGLGGVLEILSPEGGPTVVTARLPW